MTIEEYNRKYSYLGDNINVFDTNTYKNEQRYYDRLSVTYTDDLKDDRDINISFLAFVTVPLFLGVISQFLDKLSQLF